MLGVDALTTVRSDVVSAVGRIAESLGTPDFHRSVLNVVRDCIPSDCAQVYQLRRDGRAVCIDPCDTPEPYCNMYEQGFSLNCPFSLAWQDTGRLGTMHMPDLRQNEARFSNYFTDFFNQAGLTDEIGMLLPSPGRRAVALFLEREGTFTEHDLAQVHSFYSSVVRLHRANNQLVFRNATLRIVRNRLPDAVAILDQHGETVFSNREWRSVCRTDLAILPLTRRAFVGDGTVIATDHGQLYVGALDAGFPIAPGGRICALSFGVHRIGNLAEAKQSFLAGYISAKEREVVCGILDGHPTKAIADRVGRAFETVKAHKKRIYRRLDITTERELFLMFMDHLQGVNPAVHVARIP